MTRVEYTYKPVPISQVHQDNNQPRRNITDEDARAKLRISIEKYGISNPIAVCEMKLGEEYKIMEGHRRYLCAVDLDMKEVPCIVYPKMSEGEFESRRYEMQNNKKAWLPIEKSDALERIKNAMGFSTNRQLADYLHTSETPIANYLQLRKQSLNLLSLVHSYGLGESYTTEAVRLYPKIRKVKKMEPNEIMNRILEKVKHRVITTSRDFRKLGRVFLRARANENELYKFLDDQDMTVAELSTTTVQSGFTKLIEDLIQEIKIKLSEGQTFTEQEGLMLRELSAALNKAI